MICSLCCSFNLNFINFLLIFTILCYMTDTVWIVLVFVISQIASLGHFKLRTLIFIARIYSYKLCFLCWFYSWLRIVNFLNKAWLLFPYLYSSHTKRKTSNSKKWVLYSSFITEETTSIRFSAKLWFHSPHSLFHMSQF